MKSLMIATAIMALTSTSVLAKESARVVDVEDIYKNVTRQVPQHQTICEEVEVPIYGRVGQGATGGDVLTGMIIGGLIGKGATGKDDGAAAGAVIGGVIAADRKQSQEGVVGYRVEQRCKNHTTYFTENLEEYSHSIITFIQNGQKYRVRFVK